MERNTDVEGVSACDRHQYIIHESRPRRRPKGRILRPYKSPIHQVQHKWHPLHRFKKDRCHPGMPNR